MIPGQLYLCGMDKGFLFETILFYQEAPCYYEVFAYGSEYIWKPIAHHYYRHINFPTILVSPGNGQWVVSGSADKQMEDEIISEMKKKANGLLAPAGSVLA